MKPKIKSLELVKELGVGDVERHLAEKPVGLFPR